VQVTIFFQARRVAYTEGQASIKGFGLVVVYHVDVWLWIEITVYG